jgi:hypothetical protein
MEARVIGLGVVAAAAVACGILFATTPGDRGGVSRVEPTPAVPASQTREMADPRTHPLLSGWTAEELSVLDERDFEMGHGAFEVGPAVVDREADRRPTRSGGGSGGYVLDNGDPVVVDGDLAAPAIAFVDGGPDGLHPRFRASGAPEDDGRTVVWYWEFDTADTFDTRNFWGCPHLAPYKPAADADGRSDVRYRLFRRCERAAGGGAEVSFPFRVTAMRLPADWEQLDWSEFERQAMGLGYGLEGDAVVEEIYRYVSRTVTWSNQTVIRTGLDVFCTGVGQCGRTNVYCGLLLELNGIRSRGVSGFDPEVRLANGLGGHSVIEAYNEKTGRWSYVDPYLDLYFPGVSAHEFAGLEIGKMMLGGSGQLRPLADQFKYRRYFDRLRRTPNVNMLQAYGQEATWGTQWPLIEPLETFEPRAVFPESLTVHVRARYLLTNGQRPQHRSEERIRASNEGVVASPWGHTTLTVRPRELLGID